MVIRTICVQYDLPDPLFILQSPPSSEAWKRQCLSKVLSWWEIKLRDDAERLPSLKFFKPSFMSLKSTHPLWTAAESPFEVQKASVVAEMLSGRYVTDHRARHWNQENPDGLCQLCRFEDSLSTDLGTLEHMLLSCKVLQAVRENANALWISYLEEKPHLCQIVEDNSDGSLRDDNGIKPFMHFLLDPTTCPSVICAVQDLGQGILCDLLYLTRTWCYMLHARRKKLLKFYNVI